MFILYQWLLTSHLVRFLSCNCYKSLLEFWLKVRDWLCIFNFGSVDHCVSVRLACSYTFQNSTWLLGGFLCIFWLTLSLKAFWLLLLCWPVHLYSCVAVMTLILIISWLMMHQASRMLFCLWPAKPPKKEVAPTFPHIYSSAIYYSTILSNCVYMSLSCDFCVATSSSCHELQSHLLFSICTRTILVQRKFSLGPVL